jgi:hypothetical protein
LTCLFFVQRNDIAGDHIPLGKPTLLVMLLATTITYNETSSISTFIYFRYFRQ